MEIRRVFPKSELRTTEDGWVFGGVPYNSFSRPLWDDDGLQFIECFLSMAFRTNGDIKLYHEHRGAALASTADGTLKIFNEQDYLKFRAWLGYSGFAQSIVDALDARELQISPGFRTEEERWTTSRGERLRLISRAQLIELSLVQRPAYGKSCAASNIPLGQ